MHALTYMNTGHGSYSTIFMAVQRKGGRGRIGGKIHRPLGEGGRKRNVTKFQPCHVQADIVQAEKLKRRENTVGNTFELSGTFKRLLVNVWEIEGKLRSRYFFKMVDKYNCLQSRAEINLGLINRGDWRNWLQLSLKFDKQSFQESFYS